MVSAGGVERDFCGGFPTEDAAEDFVEQHGWHYTDENCFEWSLDVKQDHAQIRRKENGRSDKRRMER